MWILIQKQTVCLQTCTSLMVESVFLNIKCRNRDVLSLEKMKKKDMVYLKGIDNLM